MAQADRNRWWYTTAETAERLGVSKRVVLKLIDHGVLPAYRGTSRAHWRIRREAVDQLAAHWRTEASA